MYGVFVCVYICTYIHKYTKAQDLNIVFSIRLLNVFFSYMCCMYSCQQGSCLSEDVTSLGFISSFVRLASCNQRDLLANLMSTGPVSVGVCGTDREFLLYRSGIFDLSSCCLEQNHALLIVGYGWSPISCRSLPFPSSFLLPS